MHTHLEKWLAFLTVILYFLISKGSLLAQPADLQPTFSGKKGLPSSSVNQIIKDKEGHIWIATDNGIAIKNTTSKKLEQLVSKIIGSVKQIAFTDDLIYIANNNWINIVDNKSLKIVKKIQLGTGSEVKKLRNINNQIWAITTNAVFRINGLITTKIRYENPKKIPMDIAGHKNNIFLITYPRSSILEYNGDSFQETGLTNLVNPKYDENYISLLVNDDTLIIGGDHMCNFITLAEKPTNRKVNLSWRLNNNPAIWDMTLVGKRVFYAIGNTHQEDQGVVTTSVRQPIEDFSKRFYSQCLFYDSLKDRLYIGTKHNGVFIQNNCSSTYDIGDMEVAATNNFNQFFYYNNDQLKKVHPSDLSMNAAKGASKTYGRGSLRKIKTIGDSTYIMSIRGIDLVAKNKFSLLRNFTNDNNAGRFFNDCFRTGDSIYFFGFYNRAGLLDLKTNTYTSIGTTNFIPKVEKSGHMLICHNEGQGFKIYDKTGEHAVENNRSLPRYIDDFTCCNDTLFVLLGNKIELYKIVGTDFKSIAHYNIEEAIDNFIANWILCSPTTGIYLVSDNAIIKWGDHGQVLQYHYLGHRRVNKKPALDTFNRLLVTAGGSLTILAQEQLKLNPTKVNYQIQIPKQITEQTSGAINVYHTDYFTQNYSLKKITIKRLNTILFEKYFHDSSIEIPTHLKAGHYEVLLSLGKNYNIRQSIDIILPLHRNPFFFIAVGTLLFALLFLIFKLKYNQKIYAKRLVDNKIKMLNKNLNPHFVFNSLNLIYHNILTENKEAALAILLKFSKLQRNFLERSKEKYTSLADELTFIKSYLDIEILRYANDIAVKYQEDFEPAIDLQKINIPPNILQPLIENALKYGVIGYEGADEKIIKLDVKYKGAGILLSIENPMNEVNTTPSTMKGLGMGLAIVHERIQLFNHEMRTNYQLQHGLPTHYFKIGYRIELFLN